MKIQVTQEHIANGLALNCERCPVALSLQESLPERAKITVDRFFITIEGIDYKTPSLAADFIAAFDARHQVEPFEFDLDYTP